MFFRPDLESTLQPLNSSSRKRLSRRPREVSGYVEDQAKSPTGLGHEATPHGWRSAQSTSARRRRAGLNRDSRVGTSPELRRLGSGGRIKPTHSVRKEMAHYRRMAHAFGHPPDSTIQSGG